MNPFSSHDQPLSDIQFTDRYQALGLPYPNPSTSCRGQCDGTGWVPIHVSDTDPFWKDLWDTAHREAHTLRKLPRLIRDNALKEKGWRMKLRGIKWCLSIVFTCDGWHFIRCPHCDGTGKRINHLEEKP